MVSDPTADPLALTRLVTEYAYAIDERNFDALDRVFTADAYIDYRAMGGIDGPYPKVKAWLPMALKDFPGFMHFIGNQLFDVTGDTATGKVACLNPMRVPKVGGGDETMILGLWYLDKYERTPDGWRITERVEKRCFDHSMPEWMKKALKLA
ncbi:MAG TPA: nuclear transport factor 2 family protein [Verrucomicrobiae bacterium]|nr:nuclear transport factor 2 family protein [Verrucomicrobiae bacterium]